MKTNSAQALSRHQLQRALKVQRSMTVAHAEQMAGVKRHAIILVSGSVGQAFQRRFGPFYSRRAGAELPTLPINVGRDTLRKSARLITVRSGGKLSTRFQFTARHAGAILSPIGTAAMVPRPFWKSLNTYYKNASRPAYRRALRTAQRSN